MPAPRRPFLLIDLLGFSNFILARDLALAEMFYRKLLSTADVFKSFTTRIGCQMKLDILSDSIFIWCDDEGSDLALATLIHAGCIMSHNILFAHHQPVRGSLVYDQFVIERRRHTIGGPTPSAIENYTILGKAIVKAARWEKCQKWAGISILPEDRAEITARYPDVISSAIATNHLLEEAIPVDKGLTQQALILNPVARKDYAPLVVSVIEDNLKKITRPKDRDKLEATRAIVEKIGAAKKEIDGFPDWLKSRLPISI